MVFPVVMYRCESWTIKEAERWRMDAFELWCWRRLLRVPCTVKKSNQSILKEINPDYSLEGLMLKLKLQYFGHLIRRVSSLEKTLMLGKWKWSRSVVSDSATPWTPARLLHPWQDSHGIHRFSRQEYCSGLQFPSPGDLPNTGIEPGSPTLQADSLPSESPGAPDAGKDWRQKEKEMTGWDGWMVSPTQWTWVWANSGRQWRTGKLECRSPWVRKESDISERLNNRWRNAGPYVSGDVSKMLGAWKGLKYSSAIQWINGGTCLQYNYFFFFF